MSTLKENGGPAFPSTYTYTNGDGEVCSQVDDGMSLRDYFAAQALSSVMAQAQGLSEVSKGQRALLFSKVAESMYEIADAMLKARQS